MLVRYFISLLDIITYFVSLPTWQFSAFAKIANKTQVLFGKQFIKVFVLTIQFKITVFIQSSFN